MRVLVLRGVAIAALVFAPAAARAQIAPGEPACAALRQLQVPGAALSEVTTEWFAASSPPPQEPPWVPPLAVKLPAYCRLNATAFDGTTYNLLRDSRASARYDGR